MNRSRDVLIQPSLRIERKPPQNLRSEDRKLFEDAFGYRTFDTYLKSFGNVWVSPDSVVYKNGRLVRETVVENGQIAYYQFRHLGKKILNGKKISLNDASKYLLVTDAWSTGHFHWFMEVLPKLWLLKDRTSEFTLLMPDTDYVKEIGLASLNLLDLTFEDIVLMKETEFYKVRDLYYISRIAAPGQVNDDLVKQINNAFVGKYTDENAQSKVYISRAKARIRKVLNETELIAMLKDHRFEIIYGEDYSLADQIEIFAKCSTLMGIHGAGLTNCMLMKPGGKVIELRKREKNYGYWHLADSLNHEYYYYHGVPDSQESLIGKGCNLSVSVSDFEDKVLNSLFLP